MNSVFFIAKENEVYVCDRYKGKLKEVPLKGKAYWEVYDHYDFKELVDYLNYPLHYANFKDSDVKIVYTQTDFYNIIQKTKSLFDQSMGVKIGFLPHLLQQSKEVIDELSEVQISEALVHSDLWCIEDSYIVYAPVTLVGELTKGKKALFDVENVKEQWLVEEGAYIKQNTPLINYQHYVTKWFGKTTCEKRTINAPTEGYFYFLKDSSHSKKILKKGDLIGVILADKKNKENLDKWLDQLGF